MCVWKPAYPQPLWQLFFSSVRHCCSLEPLCQSKFLSVFGNQGGGVTLPCEPLSRICSSSGKTNPVGSKWAFGKSFLPNPGLGVPTRREGGDKTFVEFIVFRIKNDLQMITYWLCIFRGEFKKHIKQSKKCTCLMKSTFWANTNPKNKLEENLSY